MRLSDMWVGRELVREIADYAAHLPRGGAVGEWFGGHLAITAEVEASWEISYLLAVVNSKKNSVKPRPMPEGLRDVEHVQIQKAREAKNKRADKARALALMKGIY